MTGFTPPARPARIDWVDSAKSLLILLVVYGHFHYMYGPVPGKDVIYYFHVPGFLFITGFLLPAGFGGVRFAAMLCKWPALYVRAYAFFSVMAILLWWALQSARAGGIADPLPAIWGALYGVAGEGNGLVHDDQPLWYFPFLVSGFLGAWLCARLPSAAGWALAAAYAAFSFAYQGPRLAWSLDIGGVGTLALFAGHRFRRHYPAVAAWLAPPARRVAAGILAAAALLAAAFWNGPVNINGADFGRNGLIFLIGMFAGIGLVMILCLTLPVRPWIRRVSAETLTIFAVHIYLVRVASGILPRPESGALRFIIVLAAAVAIVALCLAAGWLLRPLLDRLVRRGGGRPKAPPPAVAENGLPH